MKILCILAILSISLSGCGSTDNNDESYNQYNTSSVIVGTSGLLLNPSQNMYVTFPQIENFYLETQNCVNVVATGPIVSFKSFSGPGGIYSIFNRSVLINTNESPQRSSKTDEFFLRHEFVHHLLDYTGLSWEDNKSHLSLDFGICT